MFGIRDCAQKQIQLEVQGKSWARVAKLADNVSSRNEIKSIHLLTSGYEIYFFAARNCVHTDQFLRNFLSRRDSWFVYRKMKMEESTLCTRTTACWRPRSQGDRKPQNSEQHTLKFTTVLLHVHRAAHSSPNMFQVMSQSEWSDEPETSVTRPNPFSRKTLVMCDVVFSAASVA